jgi:hypothetical protein
MPDLRSAWHEALTALGPVNGPDVRGMPDGTLLHLRDTYPIETAWAPRWVGDELRQARTGAWDARLAAIRAHAESDAARRQGKHDEAIGQQDLAASYHAMHEAYQQRENVFAATMADRATWEQATRKQRQLAIAADAELRRRHPDQRHPPLRSAEPQAIARDHELSVEDDLKRTGELIAELTTQRREFARQLAERAGHVPPARNPGRAGLDPAFTGTPRDAILQPPKPQIEPSPRILERAPDRDPDPEAID